LGSSGVKSTLKDFIPAKQLKRTFKYHMTPQGRGSTNRHIGRGRKANVI